MDVEPGAQNLELSTVEGFMVFCNPKCVNSRTERPVRNCYQTDEQSGYSMQIDEVKIQFRKLTNVFLQSISLVRIDMVTFL